MNKWLVKHRDGKHGHVNAYCSDPDCIAAVAQYMLKSRARVKKETHKKIEEQTKHLNGEKKTSSEKSLLRSSNTRYMRTKRRKLA